MNIISKYNLGDTVCPTGTKRERIRIPRNCTVCSDTGEITISDKNYTCPECRGNTYHIDEGDIEYYVKSDLVGRVGNIRAEIYEKQYGRERKIEYMLDSTGVGSGTLWKEENLFSTIEDAQAACDIRNKGRYDSKSEYYIKKEDRY